ncbi:unnamed protein product [Kluyveromyces dobzhanskii CBS 2104]|uniref:SWI5-dependent HO expression protein 3 n=1 Tax=Kluyveromyces dobzhanskii CBS 2104 TaxID=1427455 RepID=A0A0A8L665_9SACH|nr:unnamed protein product [Kluyveromyces dobzhanskii CBS 2104]
MTENQEFLTPTKGVNSSKFNMNHGHFISNLESQESPSKLGGYTPGKYSTSRVIESLHKQIDELTNTNLKMTSQCHQLVHELDSSGKKHNKQQETISRLQTENLNLKKIRELTLENEKLTEQSTMHKAQYEAIADSHQSYKHFYSNEIRELGNDLVSVKQSIAKQVESKTKQVLELDGEIQNKLVSLENVQEVFRRNAAEQIEESIRELGLENWKSSLRDAQALLADYKSRAESEGVTITDRSKASIAPLRNNKRKTSGQKRTSFYGTPTGFALPLHKQTPPSSASPQLPGLRRASSIRIPSDTSRK